MKIKGLLSKKSILNKRECGLFIIKMKGKFISFEGIEGCGKSTQSKLLAAYLKENKSLNIRSTREPGGPKISEQIRNILLSIENEEMLPRTEALLYAAARSQHTGEWIIPELRRGIWVISDRYFDSTTAYQGDARGLSIKSLEMLTNFATYNTKPDLTILVDLPAEIGLSRINPGEADRIEKEAIEFHRKVRKGFLRIANEEPERIYVVDGKLGIEEIHKKIIKEVNRRYF